MDINVDQFKFKVKTVRSGLWVYGYLAEVMKGNSEAVLAEVFEDLPPGACTVDVSTICRPTGILDKAGTPLYENDIALVYGVKHTIKWIEHWARFMFVLECTDEEYNGLIGLEASMQEDIVLLGSSLDAV